MRGYPELIANSSSEEIRRPTAQAVRADVQKVRATVQAFKAATHAVKVTVWIIVPSTTTEKNTIDTYAKSKHIKK